MAKYYQRPGHVIAASMVLSVVDVITVGLRFWLRKRQRQPLKADDWLAIPATVGASIYSIYLVRSKF